MAPSAAAALRELDRQGWLTGAIPELEAGRGFVQPSLHSYDVLDHNLAAVAAADAILSDGDDNAERTRSATSPFKSSIASIAQFRATRASTSVGAAKSTCSSVA